MGPLEEDLPLENGGVGWLLGQDSNLQTLRRLINSQVRLPFRHPGINWWRLWWPPAKLEERSRMVPGVRFERTSSRLQRDAFTRLAFLAPVLVAGVGIEPTLPFGVRV